jgi:LDH2 family malate/lactate/ureidoglycolate dehydrogenase
VKLTAGEATALTRAVLAAAGVPIADADAVAEHLVDAELRGHVGLARLIGLREDLARHGVSVREPEVSVRGQTATVDGAGRLGIVVALRATEVAAELAAAGGFSFVAAGNHRYSGVLAAYVERLAAVGLIGIAAASGSPLVAPYGAQEALLSTNPIAFGFPVAGGAPVIHDFATSAVSGGELLRLRTAGGSVPAGAALDAAGAETLDPAEAMAGVLRAWGGYRGSGLAVSIQLLTLLTGMTPFPRGDEGWGFVVLAIDPSRFLPDGSYPERAAELAELVRATRPLAAEEPVRLPFERSARERQRRRASGLELPAALVEQLRSLAGAPDDS